ASGSSPKVIGSSIAMVGIGPIPGSTPISVPSRQPTRQMPRLLSESAAPKPVARFARMSMSAAPPGGQRLLQRVDKDPDGEQREADCEQRRFGAVDVAPRIGGADDQHRRREREADPVD